MNWLRTVGIAIGGFLLLLAFQILGRDGRRAKKAEDRETALLIEGSEKAKAKAKKQNAKATALKKRAKDAAKATEAKLDEIDKVDSNMGDLVSHYRAERLRQSNASNS